MDNYEVKIVTFEDIPDGYKDFVSNNGSGKEYAGYIVIEYNGEIIYLDNDAMEPEDATLYRDLSWIKSQLEKAYELGLKDGAKK